MVLVQPFGARHDFGISSVRLNSGTLFLGTESDSVLGTFFDTQTKCGRNGRPGRLERFRVLASRLADGGLWCGVDREIPSSLQTGVASASLRVRAWWRALSAHLLDVAAQLHRALDLLQFSPVAKLHTTTETMT